MSEKKAGKKARKGSFDGSNAITEEFLEYASLIQHVQSSEILQEFNSISSNNIARVFHLLMQCWKRGDAASKIALGRGLALTHLMKQSLSSSQITQLESILLVSSEISHTSTTKEIWERILAASIVLCSMVKVKWSSSEHEDVDTNYLRIMSNIQNAMNTLQRNCSKDSTDLMIRMQKSRRPFSRILALSIFSYLEVNVRGNKKLVVGKDARENLNETLLSLYKSSSYMDESLADELNTLFVKAIFRTNAQEFTGQFVSQLELVMPDTAIQMVKLLLERILKESKDEKASKTLAEISRYCPLIFASLMNHILALQQSPRGGLRRVVLDIAFSILTKTELFSSSRTYFDLFISFTRDSDATVRNTCLRYCINLTHFTSTSNTLWEAAINGCIDRSKLVRASAFKLLSELLIHDEKNMVSKGISGVVVPAVLNELSHKQGSNEYSADTSIAAAGLVPVLRKHEDIPYILLVNSVVKGGEPKHASLALTESLISSSTQKELSSDQAEQLFKLALECNEFALESLGLMLACSNGIHSANLARLSSQTMVLDGDLAVGAARILSAISRHSDTDMLKILQDIAPYVSNNLDRILDSKEKKENGKNTTREYLRAMNTVVTKGKEKERPSWILEFLENRLYDLSVIGLGEEALRLLFTCSIPRARLLAFRLLNDLVNEIKSEGLEDCNKENLLGNIVRLVGDTVAWASREIYATCYASVGDKLHTEDTANDYMREEKHRLAASEEASKTQQELANPDSVPGIFIPLLTSLLHESHAPAGIRSAALLSLTRFACLSQTVCSGLLPDIFAVMEEEDSPILLRINTITCIGELISHQPSNDLANILYDSVQSDNDTVSSHAAWILSTLILCRVINGSEPIQTLCICLLSPDSPVYSITEAFFKRFVAMQPKKGRPGLVITLIQEALTIGSMSPALRRDAAVALIDILKPSPSDISDAFFRSTAVGSTEETDNIYIATSVRPTVSGLDALSKVILHDDSVLNESNSMARRRVKQWLNEAREKRRTISIIQHHPHH